MKLVGIMPVRNEDWILGFSLRVALKWCDEVLVSLHACEDQSYSLTVEALRDHGKAFTVLTEPVDSWDEMRHRERLLSTAREHGASHIALIDADEVLTANLLPDIRQMVECLRTGSMLDLPLYNLRDNAQGPLRYHDNGVWGKRWVAAAFQDSPALHWAGDRFHHREPMGCGWNRIRPVTQGSGGVLHFWGAFERRLRAKHALYKITERIRFPRKTAEEIDGYYNQAMFPTCQNITDHTGRVIRAIPPQPWTFAPVQPAWLEGYEDLLPHLHLDAEPWQEAESKRLYQQYGPDVFTGLDLFGVV